MCALARASRSLNCRAQGHHLAQYLFGPTTTRTTTTRLRERRVQTGRWIVVVFSGSLGLTHLKQVCSEYSSPWHLVCHVSLHPSLGRSHALLISIAKVKSKSSGRQLQSLKVVIGASEREREGIKYCIPSWWYAKPICSGPTDLPSSPAGAGKGQLLVSTFLNARRRGSTLSLPQVGK